MQYSKHTPVTALHRQQMCFSYKSHLKFEIINFRNNKLCLTRTTSAETYSIHTVMTNISQRTQTANSNVTVVRGVDHGVAGGALPPENGV